MQRHQDKAASAIAHTLTVGPKLEECPWLAKTVIAVEARYTEMTNAAIESADAAKERRQKRG